PTSTHPLSLHDALPIYLSDDAAGHKARKFLLEKLRPSRMVIKMARDERNIDVAALANRFAVVHRLEHGEPARMLLHQPRYRVERSEEHTSELQSPCNLV